MKIVFTKSFKKSILKLDKQIQIRVINKIDELSEQSENLDIKKLQPKDKWIYRLRIGKYRILFNYDVDNNIKLLNIDNRDSIYLF